MHFYGRDEHFIIGKSTKFGMEKSLNVTCIKKAYELFVIIVIIIIIIVISHSFEHTEKMLNGLFRKIMRQ